MRAVLTALAVASTLVLSASAQAASSETRVADARVSQQHGRPGGGVTSGAVTVNAYSSRSGHRRELRLRSVLRSDLKRALAAVRKLDLATVAAKGFTLKRVRALVAGKASFAATAPRPRQLRQTATRASRVTVERASRTFARRGMADIRLKPTRSGTKLLGRATRITLTVKATFAPRTGGRVSVSSKVTLKRKTGSWPSPGNPVSSPRSGPGAAPERCGTSPSRLSHSPLIPPNATLLYSQTFDTCAPWSGLSTQCAHEVEWGNENGDGYAHFEVRPGEPPVAEYERCEVSHGGYGKTLPPGEYWYHTRERVGVGFPQASSSEDWVHIQGWHEDGPPPDGSNGPADAALFVNSGSIERMLIDGEFLPFSQSGVFDIHIWHDFVVHGVWTDQPTGYLEWWIDGQYVGRMNGVTSETGGRHFWKGGIARASSIDTLQTADITSVQIYRAP
jgi:hypothetical protein